MTALLRAEWRKVFTTRLWWGMLLGAMAFVAVAVVGEIASNGLARNEAPPLYTATTQQTLLASAAAGYVFSVVVGIIMITTEYRHFTSRPTFLVEAHRGRVILAKIAAALAIGLIYGIACIAIDLAITVPWLGAKGITIGWSANDLLLVMVGAGASVMVYTVLGLGVGVLVRNQIAAVMGVLAFLLVLEPLARITPVVKEVARFLPAAAAQATTTYGTIRNNQEVLLPWQGGLLLLGWGLLFAGLGWLVTVRRDVD